MRRGAPEFSGVPFLFIQPNINPIPTEPNGEDRDHAEWKAPPTGAELRHRMLEIIRNLTIFPAGERSMRLDSQRDSLIEAINAVRAIDEIRTGVKDEDDYDPHALEQMRSVA